MTTEEKLNNVLGYLTAMSFDKPELSNDLVEPLNTLSEAISEVENLSLSGVSTMLPSIDSSTFKNYIEAKGYAETLNPLVYKKQGFQYDKEILHRHFLNEIEFGN